MFRVSAKCSGVPTSDTGAYEAVIEPMAVDFFDPTAEQQMPTEIRVHLSVFAHKLSLSRQNYPIRQSPRRFSTGLEARESSGSLHAGSATDTRTAASNEIKPSCA